tara:strand:- start:417 stop:1220 length:804 start_codon:yes stop_codon:yes gene_type:complete
MATINLGAIKFNWKGAYNNSTAYAVDDVVSSGGSSYVCILASTGNAVSNGTYWQVMAEGGDVATTLTTQGDVLYRDGSGLQRLAAGTNGQYLKTQGSGANPTWADVSVGAYSFKQLYLTNLSQETHTGTANNAYVFGNALQITPAASTDIFDIRLQSAVEGQPSTYIGFAIGVNTADSWSSNTSHSSLKISSGEYAFGMGSGHDSDRYQVIQINQYATMAELGMSAGTQYYVRPVGLIHSQAGAFKTGFNTSGGTNFNRFQVMRLGV